MEKRPGWGAQWNWFYLRSLLSRGMRVVVVAGGDLIIKLS